MKKILFIAPGGDIHTIRWINELSKMYEVHLVTCECHMSKQDKINDKILVHYLKYNPPFGYYINYLQLRKIYKTIEPDIINVHYASGYGTLVRISRINKKTPLLISVWGAEVYDFPKRSRLNKIILYKNLQNADAIASTSRCMANEIKRLYGNKLKKTIYITPFGVDTKKFHNQNNEKKSDFVFGIVKKLSEKYGIKYVIEAINILKIKLKSSGNDVLAKKIKCYIYGQGEERENLQKLINKYNLTNDIILMGRVPNDEVPNVLNRFDVFCSTSIMDSETFGVAVVEAMACELPTIVSDVSGFKEVVDNNITGLIVKRKNAREIAIAMEFLLKNKNARETFGKNGRKKVLRKYNWSDNVKKMTKIYEILVNLRKEN